MGTREPRCNLLSPSLGIRTEENLMHVTVKQLHDAVKKPQYHNRLVVNDSLVYKVQLCGMLTRIDQRDAYTDYELYDGTGTITGRAWPYCTSGSSVLTGATLMAYYIITGSIMESEGAICINTLNARKVEDHYNEVTHHFLTAIHIHLQLTKTKPPEYVYKEPASASFDLDKEAILCLLTSESIRGSKSGASFTYIMHEMQMAPDALRKALEDLLDAGDIYATVDDNHYKLAADD